MDNEVENFWRVAASLDGMQKYTGWQEADAEFMGWEVIQKVALQMY